MSSADKGEFEEALQSYSRFIEQKSLDKRRRPGKNFVNPDSRQFPVKSECVFSIFGTFSEGKFQTKQSFHWRFLRGKESIWGCCLLLFFLLLRVSQLCIRFLTIFVTSLILYTFISFLIFIVFIQFCGFFKGLKYIHCIGNIWKSAVFGVKKV